MMKKRQKELVYLVLRYLILLALASFNLAIFYIVFTPLTLYATFWLLGLIYEVSLIGPNIISFNGIYVSIISACVAASAYYLLLILNLTTPMGLKKRLKSISFLFIAFLGINLLRIFIFAILLSVGYAYFDLTHKIVWYLGSTLLVLLLWFVNIKIFKIKGIPVYSDAMRLIKGK